MPSNSPKNSRADIDGDLPPPQALVQTALDAQARQPNSLRLRLDRGYHLLRHYRWRQLAARSVKLLTSRCRPNAVIGDLRAPDDLALKLSATTRRIGELAIASASERESHSQSDLASGQLVLLNQSVRVGAPIEWTKPPEPPPSHLWRFHWHYQEYLLNWVGRTAMATEGRSVIPAGTAHRWRSPDGVHRQGPVSATAAWELVWQTVIHWIDSHPPASTLRSSDAWHPYCISRRLPVWIWLLSVNAPPPETLRPIKDSLFQQSDYLSRHLETDLGGNHLLENLAALSYAAAVIDHDRAREWLDQVRQRLPAVLQQQVLPHGEHFELAATYHCQVLGNLLRCLLLWEADAPELAESCRPIAVEMIAFLTSILHPDGEVPLLGDSVFDEAAPVRELRELAEWAGLEWPASPAGSYETGPYFCDRSGEGGSADFLIFDRGEVAAPHLPAHGHCDLATLEASVAGTRWLIDSGTFNYAADSMRYYCRSSLAHNVVTVADANQCDIWSSFRMGRRGRMVNRASGTDGEFNWATAAHDAYTRYGIPRWERLVAAGPQSSWLCADWATGNRQVPLIGYLHLAPGIEIDSLDKVGAVWKLMLRRGETARQIQFAGCDSVEPMWGWFCPRFGQRLPGLVIAYRRRAAAELPLAWCCQPIESPDRVLLELRVRGDQVSLQQSQSVPGESSTIFQWNFINHRKI